MQYKMSIPREQQPVVRPPGPVKPKSKPTHSQVDPEELSRRLFVVLAEQKATSERRRRARAEATNPRNSTGEGKQPESRRLSSKSKHTSERSLDLISELRRPRSTRPDAGKGESQDHPPGAPAGTNWEPFVPQEAAKQFARTTTIEPMQGGLVHKLSKRALKFHKDGVKTNRTPGGDSSLTPYEQERALRSEQSRRDRVLERNQFQHTRILEEAAEMEEDRKREEERRRHRHTFEGELTRLRSTSNEYSRGERRSSTGDVLETVEGNRRLILVDPPLDSVLEDTTPPEEPDRFHADEHRVDWTQSDETKHRTRLLLTPLLRKADSIWTLRGRLGSKGSQDKGESPPEQTLKSPKSGFFSKLRR